MSLKIEAGKFYKTRDGQKACVAFIGNPLDARCVDQAFGFASRAYGVISWSLDGKSLVQGTQEWDLVEEWVEPAKGALWLHLVRRECGKVGTYWDRERRDSPHFTGKLLAVKQVTITEGEGMGESQ